jgi:hypothetical protein
MYRPKQINELRTAAMLLIPTATTGTGAKPAYSTYNGVRVPNYPTTGDIIYINFKSYGGTETTVNGVISVIDTAHVVTWYRSDIKANCRLKLDNGAVYEIISEPENIEMQGQYISFKVERVKGL